MSSILDQIANAEWTYLAGVSGTATVPAGSQVASFTCIGGTGGGTLVITPGGAQQKAAAGPSLPLPAGAVIEKRLLGQLGAGTTFAFTNTSTYLVELVKIGGAF